MKKFIFALLMTLGGAVLWAGCGDEECVAGKACVCSGGTCEMACGGDGKECAFQCNDGAACTFDCPGGSCAMECNDAASCSLSCPGNSCSLKCAGTKSCAIDECTSTCALECGGAATCNNSCEVGTSCTKMP
jgi:hypothetical protein